MGIKGLTSFLRTQYPSAFTAILGRRLVYEEVYVDLNPFIHHSKRHAVTEEALMNRCLQDLRFWLGKRIKASQLLYLAMDGPAPLAKLAEQRQRRQDAWRQWRYKSMFDGQHLTPGCLFMGKLERLVCQMFQERNYPIRQVIVSGASVPDEGEQKIFRALHANPMKHTRKLVVTGDSDALLQGLLYPGSNLYILDPFALNGQCCQVSEMAAGMRDAQARRDFCLLALLQGSDCLPAVPWAPLARLWSHYQKLNLALIDVHGQIDWSQVASFFASLELPSGGHLERLEERMARQTPLELQTKLQTYGECLEWTWRRLAGLTGFIHDGPVYEYAEAPSPLELAQAAIILGKTSISSNVENVVPGAIAMMLLEEEADPSLFLAKPLQALFRQRGEFPPSHAERRALYQRLADLIMAIPREEFSAEEWHCTFIQQPIKIPVKLLKS